jgi:hypothetical protein
LLNVKDKGGGRDSQDVTYVEPCGTPGQIGVVLV